MDQYERIYQRLEKLIPDLRDLKCGDYRESEAPGFMNLHMDVLSKTKDELMIALSHTFTQNGDAIPDPDMEIRVYLLDDWRKAEALTYQDQFGYRRVYHQEDGRTLVNPNAKRDLNAFLIQWLKNLEVQGHRLAG